MEAIKISSNGRGGFRWTNWTLHLWMLLAMRDGVELWKAQVRIFRKKTGARVQGFREQI
jgi:hypothetical protein